MERKHGCAGCLTILAVATVTGLVLDRSSHRPSSEPAAVLPTPVVPTPAERFVTHSIGQEFSVGDWSYTLVDAKWSPLTPLKDILGPEIQSPYRPEMPDSLYLVLDVIVRNNSDGEGGNKASLVPSFALIDGSGDLIKGSRNLPGRGEPEVQLYSQSLRQYLGYAMFPEVLMLMNPGMTARGSVIFDVPPNRQYALYFEGGYKSGNSAIVALSPGQVQVTATPPSPSSPALPSQPVGQPTDTSQPPVPPQPPTSTSLPAPPPEASKPTSGVLCNGPVEVRQNWELTFRNLPGGRLKFTFDHDAWLPLIHREPDGTQTLIMRSLKPGVQTKCEIRWETIQ